MTAFEIYEALSMGDTTVRIDDARRERLKNAAFKISMAKGDMVSVSDLIRYLIDNKLEETKKELVDREELRKEPRA